MISVLQLVPTPAGRSSRPELSALARAAAMEAAQLVEELRSASPSSKKFFVIKDPTGRPLIKKRGRATSPTLISVSHLKTAVAAVAIRASD